MHKVILQYLLWLCCLTMLLTGCSAPKEQRDPNLPQMPYNEWHIGGRYPHYFPATTFQVMMKTQSNQWKAIHILVADNQNRDPGNWRVGFSGVPLYVRADLPEEFYICWSSFADQTLYKTKIEVPLWARQEMVKPYQYYSYAYNKDKIGYNDTIIIGFAPGGNVTGWLTGGVPDLSPIEFAKGTTQRVPQGSDVCPNFYPNGKITEITDEAKAWLKKNGMPKAWREENNNITLAPDIHVNPLPVLSRN